MRSYGHDLITGVALSLEQYRARNPAGRAILKPAEYRPPAEEPDDVYPFLLTTGRNETFRHGGDDKDLRCCLSFAAVPRQRDNRTFGCANRQVDAASGSA